MSSVKNAAYLNINYLNIHDPGFSLGQGLEDSSSSSSNPHPRSSDTPNSSLFNPKKVKLLPRTSSSSSNPYPIVAGQIKNQFSKTENPFSRTAAGAISPGGPPIPSTSTSTVDQILHLIPFFSRKWPYSNIYSIIKVNATFLANRGFIKFVSDTITRNKLTKVKQILFENNGDDIDLDINVTKAILFNFLIKKKIGLVLESFSQDFRNLFKKTLKKHVIGELIAYQKEKIFTTVGFEEIQDLLIILKNLEEKTDGWWEDFIKSPKNFIGELRNETLNLEA